MKVRFNSVKHLPDKTEMGVSVNAWSFSFLYFNPEYRIKMVEVANIVLPRMKKLFVGDKNYYLTDKAKRAVKEVMEKIYHDLQWSANMSIEEVARLRKKYKLI